VRAVVVGGTGLLGRAICRALAGHGYTVRIHYHRARDVADELVAACPGADAVGADLRHADAAEQVVAGIDRLDLLVVAIGAYHAAPIDRLEPGDLEQMLALNLSAPLWVVRAALPALTAAKGQVISLLDIAAAQPWRRHVAYASSKAAARHAVRCLALELAPDVRVNGVAPGLVSGAASDADFDELQARIPLGRAVLPGEVARSVLLLADAPPSVTGQILAVDGGRALGRRMPKLQS